ncbi:short-chain dehydrogenase [Calycina marina]|uniref:Short-chain dehydrogenase n=1 Tax=Calycina marina TaxID=1763456 RepID=A0A9P7Z4K3_9HELO|nr:short-chain dehydrogenase [Calycina marina]
MSNVEAPPRLQKMHDLTGQVMLITGIGDIGEGWGNGLAIATCKHSLHEGYTEDANIDDISPCMQQQSRIDILINNVGRFAPGTPAAIVNISSITGLRYIWKPQIAYSTAKVALLVFARATAVKYADEGVRINTVVPGLINTPLVRYLADKYAQEGYEGFVKTRDGQVRMGTAQDIC